MKINVLCTTLAVRYTLREEIFEKQGLKKCKFRGKNFREFNLKEIFSGRNFRKLGANLQKIFSRENFFP